MKLKLILALLLFTNLALALHCPIYLGSAVKKIGKKGVTNSFKDFKNLASKADERSIVEWYLVNTQLDNSFLLNQTPAGPDNIFKKMSSGNLKKLRHYYSDNIFSNGRFSINSLNTMASPLGTGRVSEKIFSKGALSIGEIGESVSKGTSINVQDLINSQIQIIRRISNSDKAVNQASKFIYNLKKNELIKDTKMLNVIFHHYLAELELLPSLHGLPSFSQPLSGFQSKMMDKVFWGEFFFADMYSRLLADIDVLDSSVPYMPYVSAIQKIKDSKNRLVSVDINYYELGEYCRKNPRKSFDQNLKNYLENFHKWSVAFNSGKRQDFSEMKAVSYDFQKKFLEVSARNSDKYKNKMNIFYRSDSIFRGQSYTKKFSDQDALTFFTEFKPEFLSMRSSFGRGFVVSPFVKKDFQIYNRLIKSSDTRVFEYIKDHMTMGEKYSSSPFASTSKVQHVANRFSKGFLRGKSHINRQKSQVVGQYRRRDGYGTVDVNRLRSLTSEWGEGKAVTFGSKYARQQEIMVAGGLSPDALQSLTILDVANVQAIQNTGEYIAKSDTIKERVFTRDLDDPSVVHVVETVGKSVGKSVKKKTYRMTTSFWGNLTFKRID